MKFGEKLAKLRKEKALSQEELAEKLNVTRQTISKWELDQTVPDTENMKKIAEVFGTTVNDLLDEEKELNGANNANGASNAYNAAEGNTYNKEKPKNNTLKIIIIVIILIAVLYYLMNIILANVIVGTGFKIYNDAQKQIQDAQSGMDYTGVNYNGNNGENIGDNYNNTYVEQTEESSNQGANGSYSQSYSTSTHTESSSVNGVETSNSTYTVTSTGSDGTTRTETYTGNDAMANYNRDTFNNSLSTRFKGSRSKHMTGVFIDEVIESNEANPNHIVVVSYGGLEASTTEGLNTMKSTITNPRTTNGFFNISFEYGDDGYINKAIIEQQ